MIIGNSFRNNIATGRFTLPVVIVLCICFWIATSDTLINYIPMAIYAFTGYILIELNTRYSIIRTRTTIHISLFLIITSLCLFLHKFQASNFIPLFFIIALYDFFSSYETTKPSIRIFSTFFFLSVSSIISPIFLYFTPLFFMAMIPFRCLTIKSFLAGIVGIITPIWFFFAYCLWYNKLYLLNKYTESLISFQPFQFKMITLSEFLPIAIVLLITLVSSFHYEKVSFSDKTRTRIFIFFLIFIEIWTYILYLLKPSSLIDLVQILIICCSLLAAHLFTLTRSLFSNIFFIFTFVLIILLTIYNLWIQFFNFF